MRFLKFIITVLLLGIICCAIYFFPIYGYKLEKHLHNINIPNSFKYLITLNTPVREGLSPLVINFLAKHKVYVSLTTSPTRIQHLAKILKYIDLRNVEAILLAIPTRFNRTGETYKIPASLLRDYPKLKILPVANDLGPITKLLSAIQHVKKDDPEAIIITIDDDTIYPFGMISELIHYAVLTDAVVGGKAEKIKKENYFWKPTSKNILSDFFARNIFWHYPGLRKRDFVIGFGAVAYKAKHVDCELMQQLVELDNTCLQSQDLRKTVQIIRLN